MKGDSRLEPDECDCGDECTGLHEADGLHPAVSRFMATRSYDTTGGDLNSAGYRHKNGALWDYGSVHNLLDPRSTLEAVIVHRGSREVVLDKTGSPRYGAAVEIKLKPVLTPQELAALAEAKAQRPRRRTPKTFVYTLAGRIASPCGLAYVGAGKSRQGGKHGRSPFKAMRCGGAGSKIPKDRGCTCPIIRAEPVEREAWRLVRKCLEDPVELERVATEALAKRARVRLADKTPEEQAELFNLLRAEIVVLGEVPSRPSGRPCRAMAFFVERGLDVPLLTDEAWAKVEDIVPRFSPRHSSRDVPAAFLEKARTGVLWRDPGTPVPCTTLMNHWVKWGATGGLEAVMERLAGFPGTALSDPDKVVLRVRCTVMPELLLAEPSAPDGDGALASIDGSGAGGIRNPTGSPDRQRLTG